jgi:outer membrane protein OmpA-like peptidoglycan-associated protein
VAAGHSASVNASRRASFAGRLEIRSAPDDSRAMPTLATRVLLAGLLVASASVARAQAAEEPPAAAPGHESEWAVSLAVDAGAMVSNDQLEELSFDGGGGGARLGLQARPFADLGVDWIEGELRGGVTVIGPGEGEPGGVVDVQLGARVAPRIADVRPYLAVGLGVGFTGPLVRPVGSAALGLAIYLGEEITLAPEVSVLHVIQDDGDRQSDDAVFLAFGVALTYRHVTHAPVVPDVETVIVERETVVVRERVVHDAPPPPEPAAIEDLLSLVDRAVPGSTLQIVLLVPPVLFDHDQSVLTAAGEVAMHDVLARIGEASPETRIVIEGHADLTGEPAHNLVLSRARAAVVADWLVEHGLPRERVREIGEGATQPLVVGDDELTLAPNRRVTIRLETDVVPLAAEPPAEAAP